MKIDVELELRHDYELLVKMYNLCDKIAADTYGTPSAGEAELEGVKAAIRKIEREIVAFHLAHPERIDLHRIDMPKLQCEDAKTPELAGATA